MISSSGMIVVEISLHGLADPATRASVTYLDALARPDLTALSAWLSSNLGPAALPCVPAMSCSLLLEALRRPEAEVALEEVGRRFPGPQLYLPETRSGKRRRHEGSAESSTRGMMTMHIVWQRD